VTLSDALAAVAIVVTPGGIAFNIWWKRQRIVRDLVAHFTVLRDKFEGIRSVIRDKDSGVFKGIGPSCFAGHFRQIEEELGGFEQLKPRLGSLLSQPLRVQVRASEESARHTLVAITRLARPWFEHVAPWGDDPSAFAAWNIEADFLQNTVNILETTITSLEGTRWLSTVQG
jgi:hypothetical protein